MNAWISLWSLHVMEPTPLAVQVRVTVVAGQTDMIPSSDDGEEDREKPWTPTKRPFLTAKAHKINFLARSLSHSMLIA